MSLPSLRSKRSHLTFLFAASMLTMGCHRSSDTFGSGGGGGGVNPPVQSGSGLEEAPNFAWATWETDVPSIGCVEWGPTEDYGQEACEPVESFQHRVLLSGLRPGESYHYRIRSTSAAGFTFSDDMVFTTLPARPVLSDDFNYQNMDLGLWRIEDPGAAGRLEMVGAASGDARMRLRTPAGQNYSVDNNPQSLRVLQAGLPGDFTSVTKIYTTLDANGESAGTVFHYNPQNFIRFGFDYNEDGNVVLVGALTKINQLVDVSTAPVVFGAWDGVDPLYLRVRLIDELWTGEWSFDGDVWQQPGVEIQHPLPTSESGLYVASAAGSAEGHSAEFDSHFDNGFRIDPEDYILRTDRTAPLIYRIDVDSTSTSELDVTWFTDEPSSGGLDWGETEAYEFGRKMAEEPAYSQSILLDGLFVDTDYFLRSAGMDPAGNESLSEGLSARTESE